MAAKAEEFLLKITQKTNKKEIFFISLNNNKEKIIEKNYQAKMKMDITFYLKFSKAEKK